MRLSYFFAAIVAASFHAGGIALPTAQDFNTARLEEVAPAIVTAFSHAKKGGNLRTGKKSARNEALEEERGFGSWLKKVLCFGGDDIRKTELFQRSTPLSQIHMLKDKGFKHRDKY
ncbi:unnamed protein product [Hyaloperonospora brassicae]|uniref:RxLR effector protein n=1 Tax=Hyaloperonospora brassicae TaxID=162125 RepID=A0AAV0V3T4_HYABA|nr:unnamed protein product [Hyaloperonospora brassicae]